MIVKRHWKVRKQDGVWLALDGWRRIKYASPQWRSALTYALMATEEKAPPSLYFNPITGWTEPVKPGDFSETMRRVREIAESMIPPFDDEPE